MRATGVQLTAWWHPLRAAKLQGACLQQCCLLLKAPGPACPRWWTLDQQVAQRRGPACAPGLAGARRAADSHRSPANPVTSLARERSCCAHGSAPSARKAWGPGGALRAAFQGRPAAAPPRSASDHLRRKDRQAHGSCFCPPLMPCQPCHQPGGGAPITGTERAPGTLRVALLGTPTRPRCALMQTYPWRQALQAAWASCCCQPLKPCQARHQ